MTKVDLKNNRLIFILILSLFLIYATVIVLANRNEILNVKSKASSNSVPPFGALDTADGVKIAGWARDNDTSNPVTVQFFVDDVLVNEQLASNYRAEIGNHAFEWIHKPFGAGSHTVKVFALGFDQNGKPADEKVLLTGSPKTFNVGCQNLLGNEEEWCRNNPNYWANRQKDTKLLWNQYVKIGINTSYGGMINQLYSSDRSYNLIQEHGGAAMQFSLWGADGTTKEAKYFGNDADLGRCDSKAYDTYESCLQNNQKCIYRINGANVVPCSPAPCNNWDVAAPWNPIMAQGAYCRWDTPTNDVQYSASCGENCWETRLQNPGHFTKNAPGQAGMTFTQKVTLGDVFAKVDYILDYDGANNYAAHPQEIPAIFTNQVKDKYYFYAGSKPYADPQSPVTTLGPSTRLNERSIRLPGRKNSIPQNLTTVAQTTEDWWGVCNRDESHCLTVASFSPLVTDAALTIGNDFSAYITALGYFSVPPQTHKEITVYVFPYKYNAIVEGQSIRERIFSLYKSINATSTNSIPVKTKVRTF